MFHPPAIQSLTAIQTCLKTLLLVIFVIKDIQTIVTTAAQGHVTALLINILVIPTRGAPPVNKTCTETVIGVVNQVEALQETLWTKLMRTITNAASRPCNVRALSQVCVLEGKILLRLITQVVIESALTSCNAPRAA